MNDVRSNEGEAQIFAQKLHFSSQLFDVSEVIKDGEFMFLWQSIIEDESVLAMGNIILLQEKFAAIDCPTKQASIINKTLMFLTDKILI